MKKSSSKKKMQIAEDSQDVSKVAKAMGLKNYGTEKKGMPKVKMGKKK